jgi:glycosyltransferase involved in cell wall biosynthesis
MKTVAGLKFGLLTTFYPPFNFGGDGIDVQRTARALVKRGHAVTVVHDVNAYEWLAGRHLPPPPPDEDGVEVVALRSRLGMIAPLLTHQIGYPVVHGRAIAELIERRSFDVIVLNNVSLVGGPGLLSFGQKATKIYIAHEHWLVCPTHVLWRFNREPCDHRACTKCVLTYRRPLQLWRYTGRLERKLPDVDMFVARSEFSREKHREFGFPRPMSVLPYFVPGEFPEGQDPRTTTRPHDRPYFLFVGRLTRLKGLDSVIAAFSRYADADLLVVGDGEEGPVLRALAEDQPNVKFLGRVANEDLRQYYEHSIAAIVPSIGYETFGIVLVEAFRFQTPVIARRIGPFPEIVEESCGGVLFSNETELLTAMARLQQDAGLRDQLGSNGYRACRERWSEDVVINRFLDLVAEARLQRMAGRG